MIGILSSMRIGRTGSTQMSGPMRSSSVDLVPVNSSGLQTLQTISYIKDGTLYLTPTLTSDYLGEAAILDGYTLDLTADGSCTGTTASDCIVTSNSTDGTILPPVQSVRLISKGKFSTRYGKIEVVAKTPRGDWL